MDLSQEEKNVQCCTKLAQEGQYRKAQQALVSSGMAEYNAATIKEIQEKHPPASLPPMPASDIPPRVFSCPEVVKAALSFYNGSAAGPSGLRHLSVVLKCKPAVLADKAQVALTKLVNSMARGKVPNSVSPFLYGARLHAGLKKDSTLRPMALATCFAPWCQNATAELCQKKTAGLFSL